MNFEFICIRASYVAEHDNKKTRRIGICFINNLFIYAGIWDDSNRNIILLSSYLQ